MLPYALIINQHNYVLLTRAGCEMLKTRARSVSGPGPDSTVVPALQDKTRPMRSIRARSSLIDICIRCPLSQKKALCLQTMAARLRTKAWIRTWAGRSAASEFALNPSPLILFVQFLLHFGLLERARSMITSIVRNKTHPSARLVTWPVGSLGYRAWAATHVRRLQSFFSTISRVRNGPSPHLMSYANTGIATGCCT